MNEGRKDLTMRKGKKGKRQKGRQKYTKVEVEEVQSDKAEQNT